MSKKWTEQEDNVLREYIKQGLTTDEMTQKLQRSFKSVQHRRAWVGKGLTFNYSKLI